MTAAPSQRKVGKSPLGAVALARHTGRQRSQDMPKTALLFALAMATPAMADTDISAMIAERGLRATEVALAALPAPTPTERFGLGGVRFLAGIETALQTRWRHGMSDNLVLMSGLPILRLPVPENPRPCRSKVR